MGRCGRPSASLGDRLCSSRRPWISTDECVGSDIRALAKRRPTSWQRTVGSRDQVGSAALRVAPRRTSIPIHKSEPPPKKNLIEYMTSTMKISLLHSGILHPIACPWPHVCLPEPPGQPLSEPFGHHRHRATPVATALARARARIAAQHASASSVTYDGGAEPATEPLRRLREKSGTHPPRQLGRGRNHALRGTGLPKPTRPGPLLLYLLYLPLPHLWLRVALGPPLAHLPRRVRPGEGQPWRLDAPRQARPPHYDQRNYPYDRDTRGHVGHRHHRRHRL